MVTSDERLRILKMVQEGKISADEAVKLMESLEKPAPPQAAQTAPGGSAQWFRVRVTDTATGRARVNVRLPLSIMSTGLKMGMKFSSNIEGIDPQQLMEIIEKGGTGLVADVVDEADGEHVEVFIE